MDGLGVLLATKGYQIGEEIGKGQQSRIFLVTTTTGEIRAAKVYSYMRSELRIAREYETGAPTEVQVLTLLQKQSQTVKFYETFQASYGDKTCIVLILEYINWPSMAIASRLASPVTTPVSLAIAEHLINQFLTWLIDVHAHDICHRDIKLENVLINPTTNDVKIIDFGLATLGTYSIMAGTPLYILPRIGMRRLQSRRVTFSLAKRSDFFAVGVVLYRYTNGYDQYPLVCHTDEDLYPYQEDSDCFFRSMRTLKMMLAYNVSAPRKPSKWCPEGLSPHGRTATDINQFISQMTAPDGDETAEDFRRMWVRNDFGNQPVETKTEDVNTDD